MSAYTDDLSAVLDWGSDILEDYLLFLFTEVSCWNIIILRSLLHIPVTSVNRIKLIVSVKGITSWERNGYFIYH